MKKIIVFGKHYEKINSVFGKRPNISLALCSEFQLRVKWGCVTFFEHKHEKEKLRSLKQNDEGGGVIDIERSQQE